MHDRKLTVIFLRYQYKLDIVPGKDVADFINEILVPEKVKAVTLLDAQNARMFGTNGHTAW